MTTDGGALTPDRYRRLKQVLQAALGHERGPRRDGYLDEACADDVALRADAESLLAHHEQAVSVLESMPPPSDEPPPRLGERSVLRSLDGSVPPGAGIRLTELPDEPRLPDLSGGAAKYEVLRVLGEGGMGKVYLAHDRDLRRNVALKVLREGTSDLAARFLEEAQVMGQLQHPNILPLLELGIAPGDRLYYTMPVVRGQSVAELLKRIAADEEAGYGQTRLVRIFLQVTQAVAYAHQKGVVHRDLKPANIMVGEHGEVQVLDWGLAKVLRQATVETSSEGDLTRGVMIMGTPAYMAPEQVRGGAVDERTDVYALGVLLYELMTMTVPFSGDEVELMAAHVAQEPEGLRLRAPGRSVPVELERVCLKALAKDPGDRYRTAHELFEQVEGWLGAESDRAHRHELAEAKAGQGGERLRQYHSLCVDVRRLESEVEALRGRFEPWTPEPEKVALFASEEQLTRARDDLVRTSSDVVATLTEALGFERGNVAARELMADYYWSRFREAEQVQDRRTRNFYGDLVGQYHDGKYAHELVGAGTLTIVSEPPGAQVVLYRMVEERARLVERDAVVLGTTPIESLPIAMDSYLVILRRDGYRDVRYPVYIDRNRDWSGRVSLYRDDEIGRDYVYVPPGPTLLGGDPEAPGCLARVEAEVDGFFIAVHPVTVEEYLEYLNDLARRDGLEAAKERAPRPSPEAPPYLRDDGAGGLALPDVDREGDRWYPRMPVIGISWFDASAYCVWRSERSGRAYRLPTENEWEKAARGVDGRFHVWGNRFDPSLCNMRWSRRERPQLRPVDEFPTDTSVYGVRGMAGNADDWTATEEVEGRGRDAREGRIVRGGGWRSTPTGVRAAHRSALAPWAIYADLSLRLVVDPPR